MFYILQILQIRSKHPSITRPTSLRHQGQDSPTPLSVQHRLGGLKQHMALDLSKQEWNSPPDQIP